ncbi:MAG: PIN domain-containing protein [Desulfosporosinus sp.]
MNVYNRVFDDQSQMRIRFEAMAIDILFELIEMEQHTLVWSFVLEYENSRNPFIDRKAQIESIASLCREVVEPNKEIKSIAKSIMEKSSAKQRDALHLACAIHNKCDYFVTCDDRFIRTINNNEYLLKSLMDAIKLFNPIDFLRKEIDIDVIE